MMGAIKRVRISDQKNLNTWSPFYGYGHLPSQIRSSAATAIPPITITATALFPVIPASAVPLVQLSYLED